MFPRTSDLLHNLNVIFLLALEHQNIPLFDSSCINKDILLFSQGERGEGGPGVERQLYHFLQAEKDVVVRAHHVGRPPQRHRHHPQPALGGGRLQPRGGQLFHGHGHVRHLRDDGGMKSSKNRFELFYGYHFMKEIFFHLYRNRKLKSKDEVVCIFDFSMQSFK